MSHPQLKNKIVFVTGASSGIGAACAKSFAEYGAKLLLCARNIELLEELAEQLRNSFGTDVFVFQLDVRDRKAVFEKLTTLPLEWKNIDILIKEKQDLFFQLALKDKQIQLLHQLLPQPSYIGNSGIPSIPIYSSQLITPTQIYATSSSTSASASYSQTRATS